MRIIRDRTLRRLIGDAKEEAWESGHRLGRLMGSLDTARQFLNMKPLTFVEKQVLVILEKKEREE